jgi:hypothetical protein
MPDVLHVARAGRHDGLGEGVQLQAHPKMILQLGGAALLVGQAPAGGFRLESLCMRTVSSRRRRRSNTAEAVRADGDAKVRNHHHAPLPLASGEMQRETAAIMGLPPAPADRNTGGAARRRGLHKRTAGSRLL